MTKQLFTRIAKFMVDYRRAGVLLLILLIEALLFVWARESILISQDKFATFQQLLILAVVAPYAFVLWLWRDKARQQELQQVQSSYHQAELFQLQEWIVDSSNPGLQIAALYRLRQYLSGKHGISLMESALHALMYSLRQASPTNENAGDIPLAIEVRNILRTEPEILMQVSRHGLFEGMNLSGIALKDVVLRDINLSNCVLTDADFRNTLFVGAELNNSDFTNARFDGCAFKDVNALDSNFSNADFRNAKLNDIHIRPSNGEIRSSNRIELGPKCVVEGDVVFELIEMAVGAEISGKLVHTPG